MKMWVRQIPITIIVIMIVMYSVNQVIVIGTFATNLISLNEYASGKLGIEYDHVKANALKKVTEKCGPSNTKTTNQDFTVISCKLNDYTFTYIYDGQVYNLKDES